MPQGGTTQSEASQPLASHLPATIHQVVAFEGVSHNFYKCSLVPEVCPAEKNMCLSMCY